ncbi:MAG TPA: 50S ribosomal protein L25 [Candidatus Paceibacterota bacterium]|nr:50S ribosomal protein L25 [Candidatus Paceibacterota bacterium]
MLIIEAKKRQPGQKLGSLRKGNLIPAVFYSAGKASISITIEGSAFSKLHKAGDSAPLVLKTEEASVDAMIQDVQYHPLTLAPIHIDFLAIDVNKEIEAKIPVEFIGESAAAKSGSGTLVKVMHDIIVKALPKNLPHHLEADLTKLQTLEDRIFVSDISAPAGVIIATPGEEIIALVSAIKEEAPLPAEPVDLSAIEVIKKGKKEEEEAAEGEAKA